MLDELSTSAPQAQGVLPSPASVSELVAALTEGARGIEEARQSLADEYDRQVTWMHHEASERHQSLVSSLDLERAALERSVEEARSNMQERVAEVEVLLGRLSGALEELESDRSQLQADRDQIRSAADGLDAERKTWEAQLRAVKAQCEASQSELTSTLAAERTRVSQLEQGLQSLLTEQTDLKERVHTLRKRKKKRFWFF